MPKAKPVAEFEYVEGTGEARQVLIDQVLWALHLHGPFEDRENGRATALLAEYLEDEGVSVPTTLSAVVRDLASDDWDNYVERDCPATRTYSIGLADGIRPGKVPFPPNPFKDEQMPVSTRDLVSDVPSLKLVPVDDTEQPEGRDAVAIALEITGLAAQLVRELPGQITPQREGLPDWVKAVLDDNERLTDEVARLRLELEAAQGLADRLMPGHMEEPEKVASMSG
jgi:hypothetical protein